MNQCQYCGAPATVHLTDIIQHTKREAHLCEGCARKHDLLPEGPGPQLNLGALVQLITGPPAAGAADPAALICPACGLQYAQFRADGRLGCPHEYDAFRDALGPVLEKVHRGLTHAGKVPRTARRAAELDELRALLRAAVDAEMYEDAARLRDRIRAREAGE